MSHVASRPAVSPAQHRLERRSSRAFLPEIQTLRMWAVGLVVLFHLWPTGLVRGGFVGVDAFFVISGFLITSHLIREVEATGRVALVPFYARRARRLLPASLLVIVVSGALTLAFLPASTWRGAAQELLASTFYVENLWLAGQAVTYSASTQAPSTVQHYWSLSTEEQFYLLWPCLILLALALSRRWAPRRPVVAIGAVLGLLAAGSLAYSVVATHHDPAAAYFVTPTRVWEFAAGGLLTLVLRRYAPPGPVCVLLRYGGLALLVGSALTMSQSTPFPGAAALAPVLGTAAMIMAGDCQGADRFSGLFTSRPAQWVGDISYSVYLWHWPLIVVAPYVVGGPPRTGHKLLIGLLTLVVAHLSRRYVEDAVRYWPRIRGSARRTLLTAAGAMAVVGALTLGLTGASAWAEHWSREALARAASGSCLGGRAGLSLGECPDAFTRKPVVQVGPGDVRWQRLEGCSDDDQAFYRDCGWGARSRTVALVGDSHAEQYSAAFEQIARERGWRLLVMAKKRCPAADALAPTYLGKERPDPSECRAWTARATEVLREQGVDLIVTSAYSRAAPLAGPDPSAAFHRVWDGWTSLAPVLVVKDTPGTGERDMPACLQQHPDDLPACSLPRSTALAEDQLGAAADSSRNTRVSVMDLSSAYCDAQTCYAVGGGLPIYNDRNHITYTYMKTLAPVIAAQLPG